LRGEFEKNNTTNQPDNLTTASVLITPLSGVVDVFQMEKDSRMSRVADRYPMKLKPGIEKSRPDPVTDQCHGDDKQCWMGIALES